MLVFPYFTLAYPKLKKTCTYPVVLLLLLFNNLESKGQENNTEPFGRSFNMGMGPGYFSTEILPAPFFTINYEYDILNNLTIAPFLGFVSYKGDASVIASRYYYYWATILPFGIKTSYYLDQVLKIPCRWDVYIACSVGFTYINKTWDYGYPGIKGGIPGLREEYLHAHLGVEYHINRTTGLFVDLSTGVAVAGISLHKRY